MNFKKLGLTLSGAGGGKGAYQIGVWQAMRDLGLDSQLSAISGTSVGGLNGAMFAQNKFDQAQEMWLSIESHNILSPLDMPAMAARLAALTARSAIPLLSRLINTQGLFKQDGLKNMIAAGLDAGRLAPSSLPLTLALHNTATNRVDYLPVCDTYSAADLLLGTAAVPLIFDEVAIGDSIYSDGGFYWGLPNKNVDNSPILPLIEAGCDTIVVVYLSADDPNIDPLHYPGVRILPIVPASSLGGITDSRDFSNAGAARRMEQGYADGLRILSQLELLLNSESQYDALWRRVRASAEQERKLSDQLRTLDRQHYQTVGDIHDFDRRVRNDDFSQKLELADDADDTPLALDHLALDNAALLADIERRQIETDVASFLTRSGNNRRALETAVLDALSTLAPVTGRATHQREKGLLSRFMGAITGKNQQIAADNDRDLARAQFAALRLISSVQDKGAITLEFACTLQNRINSAFSEIQRLGERHNRDLRRVYHSISLAYCKLRGELIDQANRIDALERRTSLHDWLLHPNRSRLDGKPLSALPVALRLACLANDFFQLTDGQWTVSELSSLKEMCLRVGLDDTQQVSVGEFCDHLSRHSASRQALTQHLAVLPQSGQPNPAALWLRDLRDGNADANTRNALSRWGYGPDSTLPAWDFLAELLYHLKDAGFSVTRSSDLTQLKDLWLEQLKVLNELIDESILPRSFAGEIANLHAAIGDFRLKVPLVGNFSAGKSTLLNCWLDTDIQKDGLGACTRLATEFHYAAPGKEKLVILWPDDAQPDSTLREERPLAAYPALLDDPRTNTQPPLRVELHLCNRALARHPDIVLVDTPGFGASNGQHERALQQYIGEAVSFILCVTRISQIGTDELAFIDRQRSLGQELSLLVCQEALNTPGQRESLRQALAELADLDTSQLVRGCSAREGDLGGFDDLLAHLEARKASLLHEHFAAQLRELRIRAERLIRQQLVMDTSREQLLAQKQLIDKSMTRLEANFAVEQDNLLRDCRGPVSRQALAIVNSYLRSRRRAYAQLLLSGQNIGPLLSADTRNACQLATEQHLTPRLKEACQNLGKHIEPGAFDSLQLAGDGPDRMGTDLGVALMMTSAAGTAGILLPLKDTVIARLIEVAFRLYTARRRESEAEGKANDAIDMVIDQVQGMLPDSLEKYARQFIASIGERLAAQLSAHRENIDRIEQQLSRDQERRQQIRDKAQKALDSLALLLEQDIPATAHQGPDHVA